MGFPGRAMRRDAGDLRGAARASSRAGRAAIDRRDPDSRIHRQPAGAVHRPRALRHDHGMAVASTRAAECVDPARRLLEACARAPRPRTIESCAMLSGGLNLVAIGGGTGLSTLLRGLKGYVDSSGTWSISQLGAIVTV